MRPDFILGCDPGLSGALCLLRLANKRIEIFDMPVTDGFVDPARLAGIVEMCKMQGYIVAAVELVSSMPRQAGVFNFGRSAGVLHGVLGAMGVGYELVSPNVWKGAVGLRKLVGESQSQNKTRARELAIKLWPANGTEFRRVKDDGRAEACLISRHYASSKGWL